MGRSSLLFLLAKDLLLANCLRLPFPWTISPAFSLSTQEGGRRSTEGQGLLHVHPHVLRSAHRALNLFSFCEIFLHHVPPKIISSSFDRLCIPRPLSMTFTSQTYLPFGLPDFHLGSKVCFVPPSRAISSMGSMESVLRLTEQKLLQAPESAQYIAQVG